MYNWGIPGPSLCCVPGLGSWGPLGRQGREGDVVRDAILVGVGGVVGRQGRDALRRVVAFLMIPGLPD